MSKPYGLGVIGCGDYLRIESGGIAGSKKVKLVSLFDVDASRAKAYAAKLGGKVAATADDVIRDPNVDIVCVFVPPWARRDVIVQAAKAGKHILTTKPLAPNVEDCSAMADAVKQAGVYCGVAYRRTGSADIETLKKILDGGELGKLALVRHDWIHHYPQWNNWALDPARNGGPFMDAEIHNMNYTRYLMGRPATHCTFFSHNLAHPNLACADTEGMTLEFQDGGVAYLFITWAADLKVASLEGNYREHIDITYFVTDQGWRITTEGGKIVASREGKTKEFPLVGPAGTVYDRFVTSVETKSPLPSDLVSIQTALEDIRILRAGAEHPGVRVKL